MNEEKNEFQIPSGYLRDARGNLVRKENIKKVDLRRDAVVRKLMQKALNTADKVNALRAESLESIEALVRECAKEHDVHLGGTKGNIVLTSFDGSVRVMRSRADTITFTEQLEVARSLVHDCLARYSKGANKHLQALVNSAFEVDDKGNVSVARILKLRQVKIDDDEWQKAMQIIAESMRVVGTREYVRFYKREIDGTYTQVPLTTLG